MRNDDISNPMRGKIEIGAEGLGVASDETVEQRASELAKIDGRAEPNEADYLLANSELQSKTEPGTAPEVDARTEAIAAWDDIPEESGGRAPTRSLDDENTVAEQLVEEGIEEADHSQRLSAADKLAKE